MCVARGWHCVGLGRAGIGLALIMTAGREGRLRIGIAGMDGFSLRRKRPYLRKQFEKSAHKGPFSGSKIFEMCCLHWSD